MSYAQTIYNRLRQAGMTEAGALGMLGNFQCESGCEPNRLEGDGSPYRTSSKEYTSRIMSGSMSKSEFCNPRGYGLAQWTYPTRKAAMWDAWKRSGKAIDDVGFQVDFAISELKSDFPEVWNLLCTSNDVYQCTKRICYDFENPAVKNVDARFQEAQSIRAGVNLNEWTSTTPNDESTTPNPVVNDDVDWANIPATEYWPPRMICEGMNGKDVVVLRSLLYARERTDYVDDDDFDAGLTGAVKQFQKDFGLDADGIVGPLTWGKLLER